MRVRRWVTAAGLAMGCGGAEPEQAFTTDIRIDGASAENDPESEGSRLCVNEAGEVFVVWVDDRDGEPAVWFNRSLDRGVNWLPVPVKVNHGEGSAEQPDLACTAEGAFIVWEDDRDGELENHQIYFNGTTDGGNSWLHEDDVLVELDPEGDTMSLGPRITAVGTDLYVAWFDGANGAYDIFVNSSGNAGKDWREPVRVDSDGAGAAHSAWPQIAASKFGDVYVVWEDARAGATDIYFSRSDNAATSFKDNIRLDLGDAEGEHYSFNPRLGVDGDNLYVVWHDDRNGEGRDIYLTYSANGGRDWLVEPQRLDSDGAGFFNSLNAEVAVEGPIAHVVWQDERDAGYDVYYRKVNAGTVGPTESRLETDPAGFANSFLPQIALAPGQLVVAWQDERGEAENGTAFGYHDLYYNHSSNSGDSFAEADLRIDSMAPGQSYKVDLNIRILGGEVLAAWTDGRNGTGDIYFQKHAIGEQAAFVEAEDGTGGTATTAP